MAGVSRFGTCAWRASGAMVAAVLMGWLTLVLALAGADAIARLASGAGAGSLGALIGFVSLPLWILGALTIGAPAWLALHCSGVQSRRSAVICGAALVGFAHPTAWILLSPGFSLDAEALLGLSLLTLAGTAAGAMAGLAFRVSFYEHNGAA